MATKIRKPILIIVMLATAIMEIYAFSLTISSLGSGILIYYTEISNLITLFSALIALIYIFKSEDALFPKWLSALRYLSTTMLLMTMLITIFVLVPHSPHLTDSLLFEGYGLFHHTLVPILTIISYLLLEPHLANKKILLVPVVTTFIYGIIMLVLNILKVVSGPYFFFKVHEQSVLTSVVWFSGLLLLVALFAGLVYLLAFVFDLLARRLKRER